jgi:hypothetical protein
MMAAGWLSIGRSGSGALIGALIGALVLMLAGCSTIQDMSGIPHPGYQKDGSYVLTSEEQGLGCRELQERSLGLQHQLTSLSEEAVKQMQELPTTIVSAWGRLVGSADTAVPAVAEYNEARAESAALNASLSHKGCDTVETAAIQR